MRKKVFIISWFYLIGAVIMTLLPIICIFLTLPHSNDELFVCSFLIVLFSLASRFFFIVFGFTFIQWVVITENEIVAKCLFGTIRRTDWKDVKEIMKGMWALYQVQVFVFFSKSVSLDGMTYNKIIKQKGVIQATLSKKVYQAIRRFTDKEIYGVDDDTAKRLHLE